MNQAVTTRLARPEDAAACLHIYRPFVEQSAVSFELTVPSVPEMAARIGAVTQTAPWLVSERGGQVLGYAYATAFRPRPAYRWWMESTIYLAPEARGSGLGRRLYEALMTLLRRQGFVSVLGVITLPNVASVALHERLGFRPLTVLPQAGFKLGAWHDVGWWHLALCEPPAAPVPPRPPVEALPELFARP